MEFVIEKVIDAVLDATGLKEKIGRNDRVIRLLKRFNLDSVEVLTAFEDLYAYALVEYAFDDEGLCKPPELVTFFKAKDVRDLFQTVYQNNDPKGWLRKGEEIAQFRLGKQLPQMDPKRELGTFAAVFVEVVKQTRSPKEIRQEQKLDSLQRSLQTLQTQIQQLPSLEAINQRVNQLAGADETLALPAAAETSRAVDLARQLGEWFDVLDYDRDPDYETWTEDSFEWIINFPMTRRKVARILVRGVAGEVGMADLQDFQQAIARTNTDEGWLVGNRRVSKAARTATQEDTHYDTITCYTFDELLDEDADFSKYLDWLAADIQQKHVDTDYLPLACRKDELDPVSQQKIGVSVYDEADGWIDGYVDQWLDDPAKEHLSVLGEFGTGKTWFALHYAWTALQRYQDAKKRGLERPRVPIVVPLRDYAKAVTVESLLSEFFFRKHEILRTYSIFEQLNRMGKLLLIFDGFDEMAARVNRQSMIDNFWELSKVVVPGAKAILTCRTEHFPDAIAGRRLLNAELKASTANLTGESPQFEVLDLEKFTDDQIATLLGRKAQESTVQMVMGNPQLRDLAQRPVMVDLILEALPEIEAGKPVDMARVYLYAVTAKMNRDIKSDRTFTSLADKLYFLCELSWEMLSTNRMSLNYRSFPERLQAMFGDRLKEERELDYWRHDMMGQTMLIRNSEGDYSPAHRSLLEFFAAYKIVASLGAMSEDFTAMARQQTHLDETAAPQEYTWGDYFRRSCGADGVPEIMAPLGDFKTMAFDALLSLLNGAKLAKAVLDLAHPMLDGEKVRDLLLPLLSSTRERALKEVRYFGGNVVQLMLAKTPYALEGSNLNGTKLLGIDFTKTFLRQVKLQGAQLEESVFSKAIGHVNSLAFSPTGEYLAIGDSKGSVQIWRIATGQVLLFCLGHLGGVRSVTFSPDGQKLVSGGRDAIVRLWSIDSGECIRTFTGHSNWVRSVAISPDAKLVASGSADATIRIWSVETGDCTCILEGHSDRVTSVAFDQSGRNLVSSSADTTLKLWSIVGGGCVQTFKGHSDWAWSASFSPDGQTVASGSADTTVRLWSIDSGQCTHVINGHTSPVRAVVFSPDGKTLASGGEDSTIKLWATENGDCVNTFVGHTSWVRAVVFSPDGKTLASGGGDNTIKLWLTEDNSRIQTIGSHGCWVWSVAFSPDGKTLASGSGNNTVKIRSMANTTFILNFNDHSGTVSSVAFSPDGQSLASSSSDSTIKLWSMVSRNSVHTFKGHKGRVWSVAFSPDGKILASGSADSTVRLWSTDSKTQTETLKGHIGRVLCVSFNPDGQILASCSSDSTIKLWSIANNQCVHTFEGHSDQVSSVAFSPDGQTIASGSFDHTVKLWSIVDGTCICSLNYHSDRVLCVIFSPDGQILASGSEDSTVQLWSIKENICIHSLQGHSDWVKSVSFSPDGQTLVSGSVDETIRFWDVNTGKCLDVIDNRVCTGMDITGAIGLTEGQRTALKLMGAIDKAEG
ncbi:NACHT domain-containing protein [Oscillatoria sp. CS-180]|uniref:NACHT and WD40 repeat domain-containing protein n=1 Tax=Oscillatoria sp. CS-180 TaxID=3021720 RepID=UPI00232C9D14|nr:NACHT domain-containing protein [Oscillatoria sp. CS-180]MDB9526926.1 NACHT domain-containing protein [Oscillatoria sp. CS-180]